MRKQYHVPQIDISPIEEAYSSPSFDKASWFRSRRFIIFFIVLFASLAITLGYVYSRPAIYQSTATLLTVAKTAIDQQSGEADIQHVAIQKQILMGSELLAETSKQLQTHDDFENGVNLTVAEIRLMLDVKPVKDTNLVEMIAEGSEPEELPALINTWIDVYLAARAAEIVRSTGATTQIIQDELKNLNENINAKRRELDYFRQNNDITSTGREENEALARLKGLNESLNKSSEEEVKAKARLDAIKKAAARGKAIVPQDDTRTLSALEKRAQELREELEELDRRYTREYMALSPTLKVIPEKLASLEKEITRMRQGGQAIVLSDAQQEYVAAKQTTQSIRKQLDKHKKKATEFAARFAEHEALQTDLEGLESLFRETQERLVQIETRYAGKYPQVDVIERAFLPTEPIRPNYFLDTIIAVVGSIVFSLFCIWIIEFLTRKEGQNPMINLSGIHLYNNDDAREVFPNPQQHNGVLAQQQKEKLTQQHIPTLENAAIKEISTQEIDVLLQTASEKEKLLIALLLSGVTLSEIPEIQEEDIDFEKGKLVIAGSSPRIVPLNHILKALFLNPACHLSDPSGRPLSQDDLAALLTCAVVDAGLPGSDEINATSFRHTYIIYLVKQGIRLADLGLIIGYIPPTELSSYSFYSPPGPGRSFKEIDLLYPELAKLA